MLPTACLGGEVTKRDQETGLETGPLSVDLDIVHVNA